MKYAFKRLWARANNTGLTEKQIEEVVTQLVKAQA